MASVKRDTGNTCTHWVREMTRNLSSIWGSGSRGEKKKSPWKTDTTSHEHMDLDFTCLGKHKKYQTRGENTGARKLA